MQLILLGIFNYARWKTQLGGLSLRAKLLLLVLAGASLGVLAAGVVLRHKKRRYRLTPVGGALSRQHTFGRSSSSSHRSSSSSHQRINSFPIITVISEGGGNTDYNIIEEQDTPRIGRSSSVVSPIEDNLLHVEDGGEVFLSLSQNVSTGVLSDEFYDVTPDIGSLIPSYPSMNDSRVVQEDYISDSDESFQSAEESLNYVSDRHKLYISALVPAEKGTVKCRVLRTSLVGCTNDRDFLAKVHCIRMAFDHLLLSNENRHYAINAGKELILTLLKASNSDAQPFLARYDEILEYVQNQDNWAIAEEELKERGVACLNIYDVALDFMLMDAFDDLSSPPSALLSVIQNGWISDSIKQSMLNTAVWSILKAKKSVLKNKNGFMTKFYLLSETMTPVFAWGFLGTDSELKRRCHKFKGGMMSLIRSMFSLDDVRYATTQTLSDDIMRLTRQTVNSLSDV